MKTILLLAIITLTCLNLNAQIIFQKTYGGTDHLLVPSVQQTADSGYVIIGQTSSFGAVGYDVVLIKTDTNGDTLWTKTYGGTFSDYGYSAQQTTDAGYIITGHTKSFGAGGFDVYLIKTDTNGDTLWTKTYGGNGTIESDKAFSVQQTTDAGYVIIGQTSSFGAGDADVYLIKTDTNGDTLWTKTYGGTEGDKGFSVQQTTDAGYIITGHTRSFGAGDGDVYLIKTDTNGDILWTKTYGGTSDDYGLTAQQTTDAGYIIIGHTRSFGAGYADVYLIKTDTNGDTLWTKTYGGTGEDKAFSVQQTTDIGYVICGYTESFGNGDGDVYLIKTDTNGDILWTKTYGGTSHDYGLTAQQTTDAGYIIIGHTRGFGAADYEFYLIKTDANGNSGCNENSTNTIITSPQTEVNIPATIIGSGAIVTSPPTITRNTATTVSVLCFSSLDIQGENNKLKKLYVYPNPFSTSAIIEIDNPKNENHTLSIYNSSGQLVRQLNNITANKIEIKRGNLANGFYFIQLRTDNEIVGMKKLIVQSAL
jgi:hypothetical protein